MLIKKPDTFGGVKTQTSRVRKEYAALGINPEQSPLCRRIDILTEFFLWFLIFGVTFSNAIVEISIGFVTFFFLIKRIILKDIRPPRTEINLILYVLIALVFVSFLRSEHFNQSLRGFIRPLKYTALYFSLIEFFGADQKRIRRFFWATICVFLFTSLNGIFQSIFGFDVLRHRRIEELDYLQRIKASFVHPNDLGAYIIFIIPLTLSFFAQQLSKYKKAFLMLVCALGFYCLLKTSSRGAWLGLLFGIFIYFFYYKKKISVVIPILLVLFIIIFPHGFNRIVTSFRLENNTIWERAKLWEGTWNMVKVHPFFGFGINTFSDYFPQYKPADYWELRYTHNSYLQMWSEIGIIGLSVFLLIIFKIFRMMLRRLREKINLGLEGFMLLGLMSGYAAFLVHSALDTNLHSLVLVSQFWVFNAYIVSLNKFLEAKLNA